jgi:hypothetical protein
MAASQRKKTTKAAGAAGDNNNNNNNNTNSSTDISLTEQLDRAQAAVDSSHMHALTLHSQWRSHLLRLSYIVIIATFHQMQTPSSACIKEIKVRR